MERNGNRFRRDVKAFAEENRIPVLRLKKPGGRRWDDRKLDHVRPYLQRAERDERFGVVAIVAAQEFQWVQRQEQLAEARSSATTSSNRSSGSASTTSTCSTQSSGRA